MRHLPPDDVPLPLPPYFQSHYPSDIWEISKKDERHPQGLVYGWIYRLLLIAFREQYSMIKNKWNTPYVLKINTALHLHWCCLIKMCVHFLLITAYPMTNIWETAVLQTPGGSQTCWWYQSINQSKPFPLNFRQLQYSPLRMTKQKQRSKNHLWECLNCCSVNTDTWEEWTINWKAWVWGSGWQDSKQHNVFMT